MPAVSTCPFATSPARNRFVKPSIFGLVRSTQRLSITIIFSGNQLPHVISHQYVHFYSRNPLLHLRGIHSYPAWSWIPSTSNRNACRGKYLVPWYHLHWPLDRSSCVPRNLFLGLHLEGFHRLWHSRHCVVLAFSPQPDLSQVRFPKQFQTFNCCELVLAWSRHYVSAHSFWDAVHTPGTCVYHSCSQWCDQIPFCV